MVTEKKGWGRVEPESSRWWTRYNKLRSEGFVHDEASILAEGVIGSEEMLKGRKKRRRWYRHVKDVLKLTDKEIEDRIDEMYDTEDWRDPYDQFYAEEE